MAMIKCPECGNAISDAAKACPNCGCPQSRWNPYVGKKKKKDKTPLWVYIVVGIATVFVMFWWLEIFTTLNKEGIKTTIEIQTVEPEEPVTNEDVIVE